MAPAGVCAVSLRSPSGWGMGMPLGAAEKGLVAVHNGGAGRGEARTRARLVHIAQDVRHARLVAHEGSEVARLRLVILREALHLTPEATSTLLGQETQRAVTRTLELTVRPEGIEGGNLVSV